MKPFSHLPRVVVIGAGVGGLTTAALLARAGLDVTVLEAHVYPGGCAGTFYHQGYRFDAGATLAGGFYPGGPMDKVAQAVGISQWPARLAEPAMAVCLPDGSAVTRWTDERRWQEHQYAFGAEALSFWRWQERTADALWDLALRLPPWPPQTSVDAVRLLRHGAGWLSADLRRFYPGLLADALRPAATHLRNASERLRLFVDGQLMIAAQTTSAYANALYAASAMDLPRRGVVHLEGGMGAIASTLAQAVRQNGGEVRYRQEVTRIVVERGQATGVETKRGEFIPADLVVANLPPWNIAPLLGEHAPARLRSLPPQPRDGWGAFMVYVGLDQSALPKDFPLHHQVIVREPLGEGNSVFLSISPAWDQSRAPAGRRAVTISTHTNLAPWWELFSSDRAALRSAQDGLHRPFAACGRSGYPRPARSRRSGAARNTCYLPTFYPARLGLGRRLSADQPLPGLGTAPRRRPVDGWRQHLPRPIDRCRRIGRATRRRSHSGLRRRHRRPYFARIDHGGTIQLINRRGVPLRSP